MYWFDKLHKFQETTKFQKIQNLINSRNITNLFIYLSTKNYTYSNDWGSNLNKQYKKFTPCNEWDSNLRPQNCMVVAFTRDHLTTGTMLGCVAKKSHCCSESIYSSYWPVRCASIHVLHEFHEVCNSVSFYFMITRLQTMLWHHNTRVNSHQRWKQMLFCICLIFGVNWPVP